jgi:hypothetical protein
MVSVLAERRHEERLLDMQSWSLTIGTNTVAWAMTYGSSATMVAAGSSICTCQASVGFAGTIKSNTNNH